MTFAFAPCVAAQEVAPLQLGVGYTVDVIGIADGGAGRGMRVLDNLNLTLDLDLDRQLGLTALEAHVDLLKNHGGRPNELASSIQGVDNIEVSDAGVRLYEAWLERGFGSVSLRAGLYDLNSEFYSNDAATIFVASPFGMGSELSASGPNGPSTFPSTALAARLRLARSSYYVQGAVVNAEAGTIGDANGIDVSGRAGLLFIAEAGVTGSGKFAIGGWRYTKKQPIVASPGAGSSFSQGAYMLAEYPVFGDSESASLTPFLRAGLADGVTTPFTGGWQVGARLDRAVLGRPKATVALGAAKGRLAKDYRLSAGVGDDMLLSSETIIELTFSDEVADGIVLQPDVQYVIHPGADPYVRDAIVIGLRCSIGFGSAR
ncbi:carbohydrate porin [Sphingomonas sp. DT-51]|uniref:carbohydrate porin n=1 Tax=Sphingomonas sp. DT-51 TaxID=3396165 RepID=UPI003F1B48B5